MKIESFIIENMKYITSLVLGLLLAYQYDLPLLKLKFEEILYAEIDFIETVLTYLGFEDLSPNSKRDILFKIVRDLLKDKDPSKIILKSLKKVLS